jgi:Tol biopolymer transport system component
VRETGGSPATIFASRCMGNALLTDPATEPAITPSGGAVSFTTTSDGCSPDQDDDFQQVFLRSLGLSVVDPTTWISHPSGNGPFRSGTNDADLHGIFRSDDSPSALSGDGRIAAFVSRSDELSAVDDNRLNNLFVRDAKTGATDLIGRASGADGAAADADVLAPASISADGRYVAFASAADNLVPGDTNGKADVFVRDRLTNTTTRVSVKSDGSQGSLASADPDISADGQRIAFTSSSSFDPVDSDSATDVYVHDMTTGTTTLVSVNGSGTHANQPSFSPAISGDGNRVVFLTTATNLWPFDANAFADVYERDLSAATTKLVSAKDGNALPGNSTAVSAELDFTGAHVVFSTFASNLVGTDDGNGTSDVFLRDVDAARTTLISGVSPTQGGNGFSDRPSISADGTRIAYQTEATDLFAGDTDGVDDAVVRDLTAGTTTLASRADGAGGAAPNRDALAPVISADGHCVAFDSPADNLVPGPPGTDFMRGYLRALDADCGTPDAAPPGPPGPAPDTTAPVISKLRITPSKLHRTSRKGAKIRFTLSEAASVSLRIELKGKGRKKGSRCVTKRRTGKRCTLYKAKVTLKRSGKAGVNTVAFNGRAGKKKLAKGSYRITATAVDAAGNRAKKKTVSFRIV